LIKNQKQVLAIAIGSAARLSYGVIHAEAGDPMQLLSVWPNYTRRSYGRKYIQTLTEWFPELAVSKEPAYIAFKESFLIAKSYFEQQMANFQSLCGCAICSGELYSDTKSGEILLSTSGRDCSLHEPLNFGARSRKKASSQNV
jgi:hypothetical protein